MDSTSWFRVDGIVAVISGGGTGLGFMMAKALAGAGAKAVYILGRREASLQVAADVHPNIVPIVCDVTSKDSLEKAVERVTQEVGWVNLVIANSGVLGPTACFDPATSIQELRKAMFDDVTMSNFTQTFHVNVTGAYFTMLAFLNLLDAGNKEAIKGGYGAPLTQGSQVPSIQSQAIFTASVGSFSRERMSPAAYVGTKSAIAQMAKHAATNLAPYQIRVNTLAPGFFPSEMADVFMESRDPETETPAHPAFMPARRFGTEEELGATILYLASRAGAYCDGMSLVNDGGRLSVIPSTY